MCVVEGLLKQKLDRNLTAISFPAFSGLLAKLIAAAAAAPDEIPTLHIELLESADQDG